MAQLDGPRLDAASGTADSLVVLLHGYGADGNDLIALGQEWAQQLPDTAFASPHAPMPLQMAGVGGRQWFELTERNPAEYWRGVTEAAPLLNTFLDDELARHGLSGDRLALVGFSQGTMMALHVGLRRATPLTAIVGYSGRLTGAEHLAAELTGRPPVLLTHGDQDDLIPVDALHEARAALAACDISVEWHVSPGLGHGIDAAGLRLGGDFLAKALARAS
jgi:phospholipase/carboxylesterase